MLDATVIKSTGSWYIVRTKDGQIIRARTRGKMRLHIVDTSNPVAVGDLVNIELDANYENTGSITEVKPRNNWIIRKANKLSSKRQILATNLDAAILVASLFAPRTSLGFIDRFILCCQSMHVPAVLFLNKTDLLKDEITKVTEELNRIYKDAEVTILVGSARKNQGLEPLLNFISGKRILLAGHSGVGKSTILNTLFPGVRAKVGSISESHEKGRHTTTFAEMFILDNNTQIIDTPGIRDFGVVDIPDEEIAHYFPEFRAVMSQCRFNNCKHEHEPDCGVLKAVAEGIVPQERYYSYLSILHNEDMYK
jgi:ribosome biogenesis GTPase